MGWFRRSREKADDDLVAAAKELLSSPALAVAIAEAVRDYTDAVAAGQITFPAHRREDASVVEIWSGVRLEALHRLFNYGLSDPYLLAMHDKQEELVHCFLNERPHLEMPQPRGEPDADKIQAVFQCYLYLDAVGTEVCDRETDRMGLKLEDRFITDEIEAKAASLQRPQTLLDVLFADVTRKAKSISLSTKFGPNYEAGIRYMRDKLVEAGHSPRSFNDSVAKVLSAQSPDDLATI